MKILKMACSQKKKEKRIYWSFKEVEILLNIIKEENILQKLDGKKYRSGEIYKIVAEKMKEEGFVRDIDQIKTKIKALKKEYVEVKKNNSTSGAERMECDHLELLEELYGTRPSTTLVLSANGVDSAKENNPPISETNEIAEEINEDKTFRSSKRQQNKNWFQMEEKLLQKNQEWWEVQFEKQREFLRKQSEQFKKDMIDVMQTFLPQRVQTSATAPAGSSHQMNKILTPLSTSTSTSNTPEPATGSSDSSSSLSLYWPQLNATDDSDAI